MYKIMIIDDNHISVDGICHNIDWSDLNAEVACKAYDGQQALDYLQNRNATIRRFISCTKCTKD